MRVGVVILVCLTILPIMVWAQVDRPAEEMLPALPPDWRGTSVSADTGRMLPGHQDFRRYDTPEQCLRALWHVQGNLYRHGEHDTLQFSAQSDTLATVAIDTARSCYSRLNLSTVPVNQLSALVRLQLALREDDHATTTANRLAALPLPAADRTRALYEIAMAYIQANPLRVDAAQRAIAQLDSVGTSVTVERMQVHAALGQQWTRRFNTAEMRKEGEIVFKIGEAASSEDRIHGLTAIIDAFRFYMVALVYDEGRAAMDSLVARTLAIVGALKNGKAGEAFNAYITITEKIKDQFLGKPLPVISAKWTINGGVNPQRPTPGRVTLVVQMQHNQASNQSCAILRRLATKYGPQGLDIVLVTQNLGYSPGSLVQSAEEEVKSIETYFLKFQKIPATIVVQETQFFTRDDGMRIPQPTQFQSMYGKLKLMLVGRDGNIQWLKSFGVNLNDEAQIDAYVARAMTD